jgi:hypothetical protein
MASTRFENRYFNLVNSIKKGVTRMHLAYSRYLAHRDRKQVVRAKGNSVLTRQVKKQIKAYARERYGSKAYWPYLAFYTELRGEFKRGWLPYDYYRYFILPKINPYYLSYISEQKSFDHILFGEFAIRPLFVFIAGIYYDAEFKIIEKEKLNRFLSEYDEGGPMACRSGYSTHRNLIPGHSGQISIMSSSRMSNNINQSAIYTRIV